MMTYPLQRAQRVICVALLLATLYCLGAASWIHVKAELAQWLIQHAWQQAQKGSQSLHIKPWPWADTEPVAQLTLANGEQWVVLRGAQGNSLAFGPGLVEGSALPGEGFSVVGGHRDTHFASLANTMAGDRIFVHTRNGTAIEYEVQFAGVVDVRQQPLQLENTHRLLLVTCFPFDGVQSDAHKRWLVRAAPIKSDSKSATLSYSESESEQTGTPALWTGEWIDGQQSLLGRFRRRGNARLVAAAVLTLVQRLICRF